MRRLAHGRGGLDEPTPDDRHDLPAPPLAARQSAQLAAIRSRLLRRAAIAHRRAVLDLGAGYGIVTAELARRCGGEVVALDRHDDAMSAIEGETVVADAGALPFPDGRFDLVFAQLFFLWNPKLAPIVDEIARVLAPNGLLVALEPDYGGLIEHPPEIALGPIWTSALRRAGADPLIGRRLVVALGRAGWSVRVDLVSGVAEPDPDRFDLLAGLPLTELERAELHRARERDRQLASEEKLVHLPFLCVTAGSEVDSSQLTVHS